MKNLKFALVCLTALALAFSCKPEDGPGKPTVVDGPEAIVIVPGLEKVTLYGTLADDNKVTKVSVSWGEGADNSVSFDVNPAADKAISKVIELDEGDYTFKVFTYDTDGNSSDEAVTATGKSYGDTYIATLANRPVEYAVVGENGNITVTWGADPANCVKTVVTYTKTDATAPTEVEVAGETTVLEDAGSGAFSVKSYFFPEIKFYDPAQRPAGLPANLPLDEFAPAAATGATALTLVDVTSTYIKNAGYEDTSAVEVNIIGAERNMDNDGGKWGVPENWNVTTNIRNQRNDEVGGWKSDDKGIIHLESQNWDGPGFTNGKVWQSPTLPAGIYTFTVKYNNSDNDPGKEMYVAAAAGDNLPDIADMATGTLAYKEIVNQDRVEQTITFVLKSETKVSLGLVVTLGGDNGGKNHWLQFGYFKMSGAEF